MKTETTPLSITRFDLYRLELLHAMDVLSMSLADAEERARALANSVRHGEPCQLSYSSQPYVLQERDEQRLGWIIAG